MKMATLWRLLLCLFVVSTSCHRATHGAIRSRTLPLGNNLLTGERSLASSPTTTTTTTAPDTNPAATERDSPKVTKDFSEKLSWQCVSNATCLYALASSVMQSYRRGETLKLGFMEVVKVAPKPFSGETGRGVASSLMQFINGNAIRVPVGPMVFSLQRANTDGEYIELSLLKRTTVSGARLGGDGEEGHGVLQKIRQRHQEKQEKKQFQMFIPMYLAATTFGWTLVVAKAVALLTLKALVVSKLAFLVAAMVIIKKMMDNASEKMMYTYPEHTPYMMPYGMDYPMHPMGELSAGPELYPAALQLAAAGAIGQPSHPGYDGLNAESSFQHNVAADVQNNTHVLAALNAASIAQKVKRDDSWMTNPAMRRRPMVYNYLNQNPYLRS